MITRYFGAVVFSAAIPVVAAAAETPASHAHGACTDTGAVPVGLSGWNAPHRPLKAATGLAGAGKALLAEGTAADAVLTPTPRVEYPVEPGKPGGSVSFGGIFAFDVPEAGRYQIAQSGRAWVDVIVDGKALASVTHGHGPECSGIAKMVAYDLPAGRHVLQVAANGEAKLAVMLARVR